MIGYGCRAYIVGADMAGKPQIPAAYALHWCALQEEDKSDDELYDSYVVDPTMDPHVHVVSISSETSYKPKKLGQDEEKDGKQDSVMLYALAASC